MSEYFKVPDPQPGMRVDPMRDRCAEAAARAGCDDVLRALQSRGVALTPGVSTTMQATIAASFCAGWDLAMGVVEQRNADANGNSNAGVN